MRSEMQDIPKTQETFSILGDVNQRPPRRATHLFDTHRTLLFFGVDVVVVILSHGWLHGAIAGNVVHYTEWFLIGVVLLTLWLFSANLWQVYLAYQPDQIRREVGRTLGAILTTSLVFEGVRALSDMPNVTIERYLYAILLIGGALILLRLIFHALVSVAQIKFAKRAVVIGTGKLAQAVVEKVQSQGRIDAHEMQLIGCISFAGEVSTNTNGVFQLSLGDFDDLHGIIQRHAISDVIIAVGHEYEQRLEHILKCLAVLPVSLYYAPSYLDTVLYQATGAQAEEYNKLISDVSVSDSITLNVTSHIVQIVNLRSSVLTRSQYIFKRILDLTITIVALIPALPVMAVIAIAIWLHDRGPIFYVHDRLGENGRYFKMFKFRSMVVNADQLQESVNAYDKDGNIIHKKPDDPRVTPVGNIIRKTSLDELPQLFNILLGDMSLIGPRPELPWLVRDYQLWQMKRLSVPQGLTGWWQVNGRSGRPMHLNTAYDIYYVENYSYKLDFVILARTFKAVLKKTGAF